MQAAPPGYVYACVFIQQTQSITAEQKKEEKEVKGKSCRVWMKQPLLRRWRCLRLNHKHEPSFLSQNKSPSCKQQEKKNQEWQNKQIETHTHTTHAHSHMHRHARRNSVSIKTRQTCNRNPTNSNDFPALVPYKGKETPSHRFGRWLQSPLLPPPPQVLIPWKASQEGFGLLQGSNF